MHTPTVAALLFGFATFTFAQNGANWNYEGKTGPLMWNKLDPSYQACAKGQQQSPVDIRGAKLNKGLTPLEFHYIASSMTIENTGRGIIAHVNPGSTMTAGGVRYQLVEMDFHHPSEHAVKGTLSDMEVDLVHRSEDGKIAILAIRLNADQSIPNAVLSSLWSHLPKTTGASEKTTEMVNAGGLLPPDRSYWSYPGSLLTPPCTEGVQWLVLAQDLHMSRSQLTAFASLYKVNTRPVQGIHGRRIEANQ